MAREFKQYVINIGILVKNALIEAHHSKGIVGSYHGLLRWVYSIIITEISSIRPDLVLQIAFKAIKDLIGPNELVSTLLIFGTYPQMIEQDALSLLIM